MSNVTSANQLFQAAIMRHTMDSAASLQLQDQMAQAFFGTNAAFVSPMQLQALQMASVAAQNGGGNGLLGVADSGAAFTDIYKGIMAGGSISTASGTSYGHSPQAISAASSMMYMMGDIVGGSGKFGIGVGGNQKTLTGILKQRLIREGAGQNITTSVKRNADESIGSFLVRADEKMSITEAERDNMIASELSADVFNAYKNEARAALEKSGINAENITEEALNERARELIKAAQKRKDADGKTAFSKKVKDIRAKQLTESETALNAAAEKELAEVTGTDAEAEKKRDRIKAKYARLRAQNKDALDKADVKLETDEALDRAERVASGKMEYTGVTDAFAKEQKEAMRRAAGLTKEMAEVFGTEDADQLLNIAKQFGVKTLDAEKDVKNMKRIMDAARTRAAATGRTLSDVMGEMQGIAAVGARAVGPHGMTAAFLENATQAVQASQASRDAGLDYRTQEEVVAEAAEAEQNFQRLSVDALFALEMMRKHDPKNKKLEYWTDKIKKGTLTEADMDELERFGSSEVAKNYANVDPRKRQDIAMNSELAEDTRRAMEAGVIQSHTEGQVKAMLGKASMFKDSMTYKMFFGENGAFSSEADAETDLKAILATYGGQQKELNDDFKALTLLNTDEEKQAWIDAQLAQARADGASEDVIKAMSESYAALKDLSTKGEAGKFALSQINALQSAEQLRNATGHKAATRSNAQRLAMYRAENAKAVAKIAAGKGNFGGVNLDEADTTTRALAILEAADKGLETGNQVDILNEDGTFNIRAINSLTEANAEGTSAEGKRSVEFMRKNAVALTGKDGKLDVQALIANVQNFSADQQAVLKEAFGLDKNADLSKALTEMSPAEIEIKLNQARYRNTMSVTTDKSGGMLLMRNNDRTDEVLEGISETTAIEIMGGLNMSSGVANAVGKKLQKGEAVSDKELEDARIDIRKSNSMASLTAVAGTLGVKGGIIEKDGKKLLETEDGAIDVSTREGVAKMYAKAMEKDVNLQTTMQAAAEGGDMMAAMGMFYKTQKATALYSREGAMNEQEAADHAEIMATTAKKIAKANDEDGEEAYNQIKNAITTINRNKTQVDKIAQEREAGKITEEEAATKIMELQQQSEEARKLIATKTKGYGLTAEQAGVLGITKGDQAMATQLGDEAIDEINDGRAIEDQIVKSEFKKKLAIATGRTPEVAALEEQNKLLEAAKRRGEMNAKWFEAWNTQFTVGNEPAAHQADATILSNLRVLGKCYDGDYCIHTE